MIFSEDSKRKALSGRMAKALVYSVISDAIDDLNLNVSISTDYTIGYPNMDDNQFKADFSILFHDYKEKWLVKSTNSVRSDRLKGNEFSAQHIRELDHTVTSFFVVVPDSMDEKGFKELKNYSTKIHQQQVKSYFTDILTISDFEKIFKAHATKNIPQGKLANIMGKDAENKTIAALSDSKNVQLWNDLSKNDIIKSHTFQLFKEILTAFGYCQQTDVISEIVATSDIPKLTNGGSPKTDVLFKLTATNGINEHTISIKNTTNLTVTVHEGNVNDLIVALGIKDDSKLAFALHSFETHGSMKRMLLNDNEGEKHLETLRTQLIFYNRQIADFAFFGTNSPLVNDKAQVADSILYTYNQAIYLRETYLDNYLDAYGTRGTFSTPFSWTRPSGNKQKFQLKAWTNN